MKYLMAGLLLLLALTVRSEEVPIVKMQTNFGLIVLELNLEKAPKTVSNFLRYAQDGFYEGTIFHRVIRHFIIQGGGYTQDYKKKPSTYNPILNEANNGLKNIRGSVAMARNPYDPDSGTSQFFINIKDNTSLDHDPINLEPGYTVFGYVITGMDVVDKIQNVKTGAKKPFGRNVPRSSIIVEKVTVENILTKLSVPDALENQEEISPEVLENQEEISPEVLENQEEISPEVLENQEEALLTKPKTQDVMSQISADSSSDTSLSPPDSPSKPDEPEPLPNF